VPAPATSSLVEPLEPADSWLPKRVILFGLNVEEGRFVNSLTGGGTEIICRLSVGPPRCGPGGSFRPEATYLLSWQGKLRPPPLWPAPKTVGPRSAEWP
jgi:hypothetical protein